MKKVSYRPGDIILFDGLYRCAAEACGEKLWVTAGRRLPRPPCGHAGEWRLIRRRQDLCW